MRPTRRPSSGIGSTTRRRRRGSRARSIRTSRTRATHGSRTRATTRRRPTTPGHVFSVNENGSAPGSGQFTNLDLESGTKGFPTPTGDGDLPASDVVRDDKTGKLYVSTDFGVLWSNGNSKGNWHITHGHAALRGDAPRDPAVRPRSDLRRNVQLPTHPLRGNALAGDLGAQPARELVPAAHRRHTEGRPTGRPSGCRHRLWERLGFAHAFAGDGVWPRLLVRMD